MALLVAASSVVACGGGSRANAPTRPLPSYSGHATELYDDSLEPAAVGLDFQKSYAARSDVRLRERSQVSDAVLRVRVRTVTAKTEGPDVSYELGLRTVERLAGKHPPPADFVVRIDRNSESMGIVRDFESRLVGQSFVAFVREFVRADGDSELHFHLDPDTKEVKDAVVEALTLAGIK